VTATNTIAIPGIPDPPVLPPISITVGCVRVDTVYSWSGAICALRTMIRDAYMPNGRMTFLPLRPELQRSMDQELAQVAAGPQDGLIVATAPGRWGPVRAAHAGEVGLAAGDLCHIRDYPNGHLGGWTINVKCKIIAVNPSSGMVTVRVTDQSAIQFRSGAVVTVHPDVIRRRPAPRKRNGGR
jgi:hypothetical protein